MEHLFGAHHLHIHHLFLYDSPTGECYYPHFTDEGTEAEKGAA